jgi:hypothetical protein
MNTKLQKRKLGKAAPKFSNRSNSKTTNKEDFYFLIN